MYKKLISLAMVLSFALAVPVHQAQAAATKGGKSSASSGPNRHLSKIVFAGLAGAILGLSTLSFYGRPQDKLSYIPVGAAVGIIAGAMFTTYKAATEPKDFYGLEGKPLTPEIWALGDMARSNYQVSTPTAGFSFSF